MNVEAGAPRGLLTKFRIASLTKGFTAVAVMQLAERKRLALEDPISHYVTPRPAEGERLVRYVVVFL